MTLDLRAGAASAAPERSLTLPAFGTANNEVRLVLPDEEMSRADLVLIRTAADLPQVKLNGDLANPTRTAAAPNWSMCSFDLRQQRGKSLAIEVMMANTAAYLILDRPVRESLPDTDPRLPMPISQGFRRQSVQLSAAKAG
jgi:hypothetical protein